MKEQTFKRVDKKTFLHVQQNIKDDISRVLNYDYASKKLDGNVTVDVIGKIISYLTEYLNYRIKKYIVGIV
jgi:thymidylate synthase